MWRITVRVIVYASTNFRMNGKNSRRSSRKTRKECVRWNMQKFIFKNPDGLEPWLGEDLSNPCNCRIGDVKLISTDDENQHEIFIYLFTRTFMKQDYNISIQYMVY